MATSKHFLEQVKTGDVAAALQTALGNAGSLTIVTHIAGAGSANDLPDSQKILTRIDAVAGTIETSVGEKFVQDESFKTLCEGHMQQVVAGCSSVRDNLDTIQALLDWVSEEPVAIDGAGVGSGSDEVTSDEVTSGEVTLDDGGMDAGTVGAAAAAGLGAAGLGAAAMGVAATSSPVEDSMLDVLETPAEEEEAFGDVTSFGESASLDELAGLEASDSAADSALLDDLNLDSESSEGALDLGDGLSFGDDSDLGEGLDLDEGFDLGGDSDAAALVNDDLGLELSDSSLDEAEDAGPATEFLMADAGDNTQLFGSEEAGVGTTGLETPDFGAMGADLGGSLDGDDLGAGLGADLGADFGDTAAAPQADAGSSDPLAGLDLGVDLGGDTNNDDPFNLDGGNAMEASVNLEEDTLAGVSWAESGNGEGELDLGSLDLSDDSAPDAAPDPEVDDLALDAIGDFDSGMWDEASSETVGLQEGDESPAKVSRSLESLFSADEGTAPNAEGEASSGDPLSALFSDTSLDDIPSDSAAESDSQETLTANPFEIDDLENDPFADLMLDDPNG